MTDRSAYALIALVTVAVVGLVGALMLEDADRTASLNVAALPLVNACLNTTSAGLLVAGWVMIRRHRFAAHVACMAAAFVISTLFLLSYVTYHYFAGSRPFTGQGWIRPVYFAILLTHIVLAAAIVPLALTTIYHGVRALRSVNARPHARARAEPDATVDALRSPPAPAAAARWTPRGSTHARIARWTLPIWLYVSVTGVIVYWLLHHW